ncbi:hypothetical protein GBAR_LOCUS13002 [Geodia barretti]|uniref:Death domain-containing protein n=1 Tax=Geodia barretti TaxID=519541 RepID=A0AA35WMA2_GEOBA|nr:hypothetical protein GBAR_LOCUS13002 [Geodia barretti]
MREVREVGDWWEEYGLGAWLYIPPSKREDIKQKFPDEMEQKKQLISHWIYTDPLASWRRLIRALDVMEETKMADSIRSYGEPLTDDSLTPHTLLPAVSSVRQFWRSNFNDEGLLQMLCVPQPVMDGIRASPSHSTEEEKDCWSTVLPPDSTWCIMGEDSWSIMEDGGAHSPGGSQTTSTSLWKAAPQERTQQFCCNSLQIVTHFIFCPSTCILISQPHSIQHESSTGHTASRQVGEVWWWTTCLKVQVGPDQVSVH